MPQARGEVAATVVRGEIVVAGGFLADGSSSRRVDAFAPATGRWRRLPDLPVALNHAMATAAHGRLYVFGGYASSGRQRGAFALMGGRWRRLAPLPEPRAAGGAVAVGGKLYVVGGVGGSPGAGDVRVRSAPRPMVARSGADGARASRRDRPRRPNLRRGGTRRRRRREHDARRVVATGRAE